MLMHNVMKLIEYRMHLKTKENPFVMQNTITNLIKHSIACEEQH